MITSLSVNLPLRQFIKTRNPKSKIELMKAVIMTGAGSPDVLELQEVTKPSPQSHELLIKLKAAGVNPIDTKLRQRGTFYPDRGQAILGCDGAGIVEAVGANVSRFRVGDEVYFCNGGLGSHQGNYAEYTTIDERFAAFKPRSLSFAEAAAAPLVLITAWEALCDRARLAPQDKVLIHAGAGGVGHVAIQIAKLKGADVCTTVSSPEKAEFVRSLGADMAINYTQSDFVQAVLDWSDGLGVDVAFDTVGGEVLTQSFPAVRVYGDVVTILEPDAKTSWKVARSRNLRMSLELMLTPMLQGLTEAQSYQGEILKQCADAFDSGCLKIHVSHRFDLAQAAEAHRLLENGSMMGKIVLLIDN